MNEEEYPSILSTRVTFLEYCLMINRTQVEVKKALGITRKPKYIDRIFYAGTDNVKYTLFYPKNETIEMRFTEDVFDY